MPDFTFTGEQHLIRDSVDRLLASSYAPDARLKHLAAEHGIGPALWASLCDLGLPALLVPEAQGGLGGGALDVMIVMEVVGKHLLVAPVLSSCILGTAAIAWAGSEADRERWLPDAVAGDRLLAFAIEEADERSAPAHPRTTIAGGGDDAVVSGRKVAVPFAPAADSIIVTARNADGLALGIVDAKSPGIEMTPYRLHDGSWAADIVLNNVPVGLLGSGDRSAEVARLWDLAHLAQCAEAVGIIDMVFRKTVDYLKLREQFGASLATFQALQHRLTDLYATVELCRSMLYLAADAMNRAAPEERSGSLTMAKSYIARSAVEAGKESVQLHGGIGMTWDYPVGHGLKRLMVIDRQFGSAHRLLTDRAMSLRSG